MNESDRALTWESTLTRESALTSDRPLAAVTLTWSLNRHWVFEPTENRASEYGRYVSAQLFGAAINLSVYAAAIELFAPLARVPAAALAIGSAAAMAFNYLASSRIVFRHSPPAARAG